MSSSGLTSRVQPKKIWINMKVVITTLSNDPTTIARERMKEVLDISTLLTPDNLETGQANDDD